MEHASLFQLNAHQVLLGTVPMVVLQHQTHAQLDHITMELNVFHIYHVTMERFGMIL